MWNATRDDWGVKALIKIGENWVVGSWGYGYVFLLLILIVSLFLPSHWKYGYNFHAPIPKCLFDLVAYGATVQIRRGHTLSLSQRQRPLLLFLSFFFFCFKFFGCERRQKELWEFFLYCIDNVKSYIYRFYSIVE